MLTLINAPAAVSAGVIVLHPDIQQEGRLLLVKIL